MKTESDCVVVSVSWLHFCMFALRKRIVGTFYSSLNRGEDCTATSLGLLLKQRKEEKRESINISSMRKHGGYTDRADGNYNIVSRLLPPTGDHQGSTRQPNRGQNKTK